MKFSFPTVVTLITVLVSASAESTFLSGGSLNHEDGTNFNHRALRGDAEVMVKEEEMFAPKPSRDRSDAEGMVKEEESQAWKPIRQLDECKGDGTFCVSNCVLIFCLPPPMCEECCNGYHLGTYGVSAYCGPNPVCWGKGTYCVPEVSCGKCCNSWSMHLTGGYCD